MKRRLPDYERIARLEWEIYGEVFTHAGSGVNPVVPCRFISPLSAYRMTYMNAEESVAREKAGLERLA